MTNLNALWQKKDIFFWKRKIFQEIFFLFPELIFPQYKLKFCNPPFDYNNPFKKLMDEKNILEKYFFLVYMYIHSIKTGGKIELNIFIISSKLLSMWKVSCVWNFRIDTVTGQRGMFLNKFFLSLWKNHDRDVLNR